MGWVGAPKTENYRGAAQAIYSFVSSVPAPRRDEATPRQALAQQAASEGSCACGAAQRSAAVCRSAAKGDTTRRYCPGGFYAQNGFSLVELMVAVAIVALLAAFGLPAYQDYVLRTKVMEGVASLSGLRQTMVENALTGAPLLQTISDPKCVAHQGPSCTKAAGATSAFAKSVKRVEVARPGTLVVYFTGSPAIEDKTLLLVAKKKSASGEYDFLSYDFAAPTPIPEGRVAWSCRSADTAGPAGWGRGTLPGRYAPPWCLEVPLE